MNGSLKTPLGLLIVIGISVFSCDGNGRQEETGTSGGLMQEQINNFRNASAPALGASLDKESNFADRDKSSAIRSDSNGKNGGRSSKEHAETNRVLAGEDAASMKESNPSTLRDEMLRGPSEELTGHGSTMNLNNEIAGGRVAAEIGKESEIRTVKFDSSRQLENELKLFSPRKNNASYETVSLIEKDTKLLSSIGSVEGPSANNAHAETPLEEKKESSIMNSNEQSLASTHQPAPLRPSNDNDVQIPSDQYPVAKHLPPSKVRVEREGSPDFVYYDDYAENARDPAGDRESSRQNSVRGSAALNTELFIENKRRRKKEKLSTEGDGKLPSKQTLVFPLSEEMLEKVKKRRDKKLKKIQSQLSPNRMRHRQCLSSDSDDTVCSDKQVAILSNSNNGVQRTSGHAKQIFIKEMLDYSTTAFPYFGPPVTERVHFPGSVPITSGDHDTESTSEHYQLSGHGSGDSILHQNNALDNDLLKKSHNSRSSNDVKSTRRPITLTLHRKNAPGGESVSSHLNNTSKIPSNFGRPDARQSIESSQQANNFRSPSDRNIFHRGSTTSLNRRSEEDGTRSERDGWSYKTCIVEGNITLGALMMVHERDEDIICGKIMPQGGIQALEAMLFTLDHINERLRLLPNLNIGAFIHDDCDQDTYGLEKAVDFIKAGPSQRSCSQEPLTTKVAYILCALASMWTSLKGFTGHFYSPNVPESRKGIWVWIRSLNSFI